MRKIKNIVGFAFWCFVCYMGVEKFGLPAFLYVLIAKSIWFKTKHCFGLAA